MKKDAKNLNWVMFESAITAGTLSTSIMTPFFHSIGLNNFQISLSQSIFTIVMILLDLPMGWIADRFSRKWANVIGDLGMAIMLLFYATVNSFGGVVMAEIGFAIFNSLSAGVDIGLIQHFSNRIDENGNLFKTKMAQVSCWSNVAVMVMTALGGPIGAIDFRLAIALSAVLFVVGAIISAVVDDNSEKLVPVEKNPLQDLLRVIKESAKHPKLRLRIFAQAIGREMTHAPIWFFTPMLLAIGVPLELVSLGWVLNYGTATLGALLAKKLNRQLKDWVVMGASVVTVALALGVISIKITAVTLPFYLLLGLVQGWTSATLKPMTQKFAKNSEQTSVSSLASTIGRIIYAIAGVCVGIAADCNLQLAMLTNLVIFVPAGAVIAIKLFRER